MRRLKPVDVHSVHAFFILQREGKMMFSFLSGSYARRKECTSAKRQKGANVTQEEEEAKLT